MEPHALTCFVFGWLVAVVWALLLLVVLVPASPGRTGGRAQSLVLLVLLAPFVWTVPITSILLAWSAR